MTKNMSQKRIGTMKFVLCLLIATSSMVSASTNPQALQGNLNVVADNTNRETPAVAIAQQQPGGVLLRGKVVDVQGEGLPGALITITGSTKGAVTDGDGNFELNGVTLGMKLKVTFVGMQDKEIVYDGKNNITVVLEEKVDELEEVTVVAFGRQKKASVVAAIETVNTKDLKIASSNLTAAFAGKIPGMISYQTTGEPGEDIAQFFVRGVTTFGYKTSPLILIDGFEATSTDLARIQPDDVESFSVLRDASATVLYGARGANGIILISTKSGGEGPVKLNIRVDTHIATPTRILEFLDGEEYMQLYNEARQSRNLDPFYSEQKIYSTRMGENPMVYPNVDWYGTLFKNQTVNTKANINVSGGGAVATYYVSGGYDNETGLLNVDGVNNFNNNINIDRFHIRTNVIFKLTPTTKLDTRIQGRFENYNGPYTSTSTLFSEVMNSNPVDFPAVFIPDAAHQYTDHILFGSMYVSGSTATNPYAQMVRGYEERNETTINAQATLMQDLDFITPNLKFQAKASAKVWSKYSSRRTYLPYYYMIDNYSQVNDEYSLICINPNSGRAYLGNVEPGRDADGLYYFEARLNWDKEIGKHSIGAMTVFMSTVNLLTGGNNLTIYETLPEKNLGNSSRFNYNYDNKYFLELSYGYNGSEKFTGSKQFGFFPSVGTGWLLSNEDFWSPLKNYISAMKLKFTWGLVGNDAIASRSDRFFFLSDIVKSGGSYLFGESFNHSESGYTINRYANPDISWEVSEKYNLGLEVSLFPKEQLKFQVDFFKDFRNKIYLARTTIPATAGFESAIRGNVGRAIAQGIDGSLDLSHSFGPDTWLTGRVNFTYSTNEYVELDEPVYEDAYLQKVGQNINQQWGLVAERLFVDEAEINNSPAQNWGSYEPGDIRYRDINDDGVVNDNDRIPMGYPTVPEIQYGFGLSGGHKNYDLSFFFQGNARVSFFIDPTTSGIAPFIGRRNALTLVARDAWTQDNQNVHAFWPRLTDQSITNNTRQSSWWLRDGSFLRMKTVEAGYNLKDVKFFHKAGIKGGRIYASGENLFVISPFKLWDPEMGGQGLGYPIQRRYNIGVQFNF